MTANQFDKKTEAWSALFTEPMSELVQRYTSSVAFDRRLWRADIAGSAAHAGMLAAQGVISAADLGAIKAGLATIADEIERGTFEWRSELEDVHLNIEARLVQLAGDAGKRRTPALAQRPGRHRRAPLVRDEITGIGRSLAELQRALVELADQHTGNHPARVYPPAGGPARCRSRITRWPTSRCSPATPSAWPRSARTNRLPLGAAAACRHQLLARPRDGGQGAGHAEICRNSIDASATATSRSSSPPRPACAWFTSRASARSWCSG
jgi:argininosuccinate lyase